MQKILTLSLFILLIHFISSCGENKQSASANQEINQDSLIKENGKEWIVKNIESFFNSDENFKKGFSYLCTEQYAAFKKDAANVDMDNGLTEAEYKTKWGSRYSEFAGIGEGFMIAGTDFGKIEVSKCEFKNETETKNLLFDVLIIDKTYNSKFTRKVILAKKNDSFLIDDVLEISNEFNEHK